MLEVGVFTGVSTAALLAGVEEHGGHVWSIDQNYGCSVVWKNHPQWTFIHADSQTFSGFCNPLNLLFIDGDHSYGGCLKDLRCFGPSARIILVHDVLHPYFPSVRQAFNDFAVESKMRAEIREGSYGLGILCRM